MGLFRRRAAKVSEPEDVSTKGLEGSPEFIRTLAEGWWPSAYGTMYRRQPAVRAVVDWLARNIGQLNPKVYERVGNADRLELSDHRLALLLRRPNPSTTRYRFLRDLVADIAIHDRAFWVKQRRGGAVALVRMPPNMVSVETRDGRTVWRGPNGETYTRNQLVLFHGYSPSGDELGVSPMETLRQVLLEEKAALEHRRNMWLNAARQSGWIQRPLEAPRWSDEARTRFRHDVESMMTGGDNAGRFGVLEEGMVWNGSAFSPKDTEYLMGRKLTYEEVCIAYGLKPSLLGLGTDTASSADAAHRHAYQDVLGPWLRMIQDEIELQLLPEFEVVSRPGAVYVEFNLSEKMKGSFEEQGKTITTSVGVPYMTVNEGRARLNLPRVDETWADTPVQPLNVMYGGQPAVTVPTAVPEPKAVRTKAVAPPVALNRHREAAKDFQKLFAAFFGRQETAVVSALGGKAAVDQGRWVRELSRDLFVKSWDTASETGRRAARQLRGVYDEERTRDYLAENAQRTSEQVNEHTFAALAELGKATDLDQVRNMFGVAKESRAEQLGISMATLLINFARTEAGRHTADTGRQVMKTWVVTSGASRHPEMDGEQVPVDDVFSNGARWPGDPSLGAAGAAGCHCLLDIGE